MPAPAPTLSSSSIPILMIDNYDSFTWNLVHYLGQAGAEVEVVRNDTLSVEDALAKGAAGILISPGPCDPAQAGIIVPLIRACAERGVPVMGVCLGHQAIGEAFGGRIIRAARVLHGKVDDIGHDGTGLFAGLPSPLRATRYHSLTVEPESLSDCLRVTATSGDGTIMGLAHRTLPIEGVQFHPESIRSEHGHEMIENFLRRCSNAGKAAA
ncbi:aminodeoxychorismate/anthranilate synthase component II [Paracoccus sp. Z118]|uniref:anthranilate synthase component II n=1 Tax=Paracoccus sp. Z118 TaxID=2851017 RepID=UPI001C2C6F14|nr:aminodeoxychorismate/anthranilate synthase component II [Paracoccus sp. Z118]MBV0891012.1 aminodeoxychorismate/anthranilate synthase component II [Paracoccus sp. Z118]